MTPVDRTDADIAAMRRAIELAELGGGAVLPNPQVGCVILAPDGEIVGEGWHQQYGGPHAEVHALAHAGPLARGATAVVTLEPCAHTGKTGPCTAALLAAGVARVVVAVRDPWAPAAGGVEILRAAGVQVETGLLEEAAAEGNRVWLTGLRTGRPYVTFKAGMTVDGRIAAPDRTSKWITSAASRADVHLLRRRVDTMLVGVGTVLADDPLLTVRGDDGLPLPRQPLRVVVDSAGRTPPDAQVRNGDAPTWIASAGEVATLPNGKIDLADLLRVLYERGQRHVLLEGGPRLSTAFVDAGLVDEVVVYIAPTLLTAGRTMLDGGSVTTLTEARPLRLREIRQIGDDVKLRYACAEVQE